MSLRHIFLLLLSTISTSSLADALDINLSNDVAHFQYLATMGNLGGGKSEGHLGILYNDANSKLADVGLVVSNTGDSAAIASLGLGIKVIAARIEKMNSLNLAIGGQIHITPADDRKFGIIGQLYYAPDIVTFGDAEQYIETGVRMEYELMPKAAVYIGYRKIEFEVNVLPTPAPSVNVEVDEGVHIGVRIAF